ncbi:8615_t:CDS:1, partial [Funneliformis caledonium]
MNGGGSSSKAQLNKKTFIQSKLCFPETTQSTTNKEKGKYVSCSVVSEKRKDSNSDITHEI